MSNQIEAEVDAPEVDGADGNAPELTEEQQKQFEDARKAFLDDDKTIRFVDSPSNWEALLNYLDRFEPPLPLSPAALSFGYEQLSASGDLDLEEPPTEDEVKEALKDHTEKQARQEPKSEPATVEQAAREMSDVFRKRRGPFTIHRNGKRIDSGFGS